MSDIQEYITDGLYGNRLLISVRADQTELADNIRVARVLLRCSDDMYIIINEHLMTIGHKNPEYTINGKLGDRKIISGLLGRHEDFSDGSLEYCYIVHRNNAVVLDASAFLPVEKDTIRQIISDVIERLRT